MFHNIFFKEDLLETIFEYILNMKEYELCNQAMDLFKQEKYEEAMECLDKALLINPKNMFTWTIKGMIYYRLERYEEAIECFDKALEQEIDPKSLYSIFYPIVWNFIWNMKGDALTALGRYEEALECYNKVLETDPKSVLENAFSWEGEDNKEITLRLLEIYEQKIGKCEKIKAWMSKGLILDKLGRFEDAVKCFDKVLEIEPQNVKGWYYKGHTLANLGMYDEAIKCFEKVLEIEPEYIDAWKGKGDVFYKMGRYLEALECYNKYLSVKEDPEVRIIKEEIEIKLGKPKLKVEILTNPFIIDRWKKVEMDVINEGDAVARDITFKFSEEVEVKGIPELEVKPEGRERVKFYLKPNALGEVPVEVEIECKDHRCREYKFKQIVEIIVENENIIQRKETLKV